MILRFNKFLKIAVLLLLVLVGSVYGQSPTIGEYNIKAAFLYNFAKFVDWPKKGADEQSEAFVIGIIGDDPFGSEIEVIKGKSVKGMPLKVRHYEKIEDISDCKILFISSSSEKEISKILEHLKGNTVLTVGDTEGFARQGVMVNLIKVENRIRFEINPEAAKSEGLKISSHLLRLAKIIEQGKL
jgi:hypothetical protein